MKNLKSLEQYINEASSSETASITKVNEMEEYMFFGNLKTIKSRIDELLSMDPTKVELVLKDGHAWAIDHIATSKDDIEEVADFLKNNVK
jgi:hypothetical protein